MNYSKIGVVMLIVLFLIEAVLSKGLNKSVLIMEHGFATNSVVIDLSVKSIDSIDLNTFNDYVKLEELYLDDNKLTQLQTGLFSNLVNLRELWLESNHIISIDKSIFNGLINLELVCLSNNPVTTLFPNQVASLCDSSNPKCKIKVAEKCQRKQTTRITTTKLTTSIEILIYRTTYLKYIFIKIIKLL